MFRELAEHIARENIEITTINVESKNSTVNFIELSKFTKYCIRLKAKLAAMIIRLLGKKGPRSLNIFNSQLLRIINDSDFDLVHLHWINGEALSITDIANINKPTVWTFHDMWPLTGSEHVPIHYESAIRNKNLEWKNWLDYFLYRRKSRYWTEKEFNIISPSRWLAAITTRTQHFKNSSITVIPNGIDTSLWRPIRGKQRSNSNLGRGKKRIMFGVFGDLTIHHKGFDLFEKAISYFQNTTEYQFQIILIGKHRPKTIASLLDCDILSITQIQDRQEMARLYNSVDVVVIPSRVDNFPTMALEASACGAPIAGFDSHGLAEIVLHTKTGYLAKPFCPTDLAQGINYCLSNFSNEIHRHRIADYSKNRFDIKNTARAHIELYQQILKK